MNSIKNPHYRKSNCYLSRALESKVTNIAAVYPRAKIHLSLLLPTRSTELNSRIRDLNNLITDMAYRHRNVSIIDNSLFGDTLSNEHGSYDKVNRCPNVSDAFHLGRKGIRRYASSIKTRILAKKTRKPHRGSPVGRDYRAAAVAGHLRSVNGYQSP